MNTLINLILWVGLLSALADGFIILYMSNRPRLKRDDPKLYDKLQNTIIVIAALSFTCLYVFCCMG